MSTGRNRSSAVRPMRSRARSRSETPGRFTTMALPWRRISGSATPRESTRLRMISMASSRAWSMSTSVSSGAVVVVVSPVVVVVEAGAVELVVVAPGAVVTVGPVAAVVVVRSVIVVVVVDAGSTTSSSASTAMNTTETPPWRSRPSWGDQPWETTNASEPKAMSVTRMRGSARRVFDIRRTSRSTRSARWARPRRWARRPRRRRCAGRWRRGRSAGRCRGPPRG